ncbi:MAG TPA: hypothetical protein VG821_04780 [Rhizomicrobium sp.]|jgi:hypothetical protein|nr:hypothetical protein [Rhizomicrobium sp.]
MEITQVTATVGVVTGSAALAISLLAYTRDRAKVWVTLEPDRRVQNSSIYSADKIYWTTTVTNIGRRPVFIDTVAVLFPDGTNGILADHLLNAVALKEGDAPKHYLVEQDELNGFSLQWPAMIVLVRTSDGRQYRSRFIRHKPKAGETITTVRKAFLRLQLLWNHRWAFRRRKLY